MFADVRRSNISGHHEGRWEAKLTNKGQSGQGCTGLHWTHDLSLSKNLTDDISFSSWCVWPDMDGFTPQLQIPITTLLDQQQHMELVQWWVTAHTASVESYVVTCAVNNGPWSNLAYCFHQQASLYRGGYNRFTPYWATRQVGGWGGLSCTLGLADPLTLQDR